MRAALLPLALLALAAPVAAAPASAADPPAPRARAASSDAPIRVSTVRVGRVRLAYRTVGSGPPLVLIAGYGVTMAEWDPELLAALGRTRRVVIFDNRGMGLSSTTPNDRLTIRQMADDTAGLIARLGLGRADVLGWSMGGYIAQELALRHPERVRRLVLVSTDPGSPRTIQPSRTVIDRLENARSPNQLLPLLFPPAAMRAGLAWMAAIGSVAGRLPAGSFNTPPAVMEQQTLAVGPRWDGPGQGSYARLPELCPQTLIAAGTEDVIVPFRNAALLRRIPTSRLEVFRRAGHALLFQNIPRFSTVVTRFLTGRELRPGADRCR